MNGIDTEVLAQIWVNDETGEMGGMERCVITVDRSDQDEVNIMITEDGDERTHLYIAPDRALRLAQALIFEASKEFKA
jgi:hypothetical protein